MHLETVLTQMRHMRLSAMADSLQHRLANGDHKDLSHEEFISLLVNDEHSARHNRKLTRMIGRANFKPEQACIENIRFDQARGFKKMDMMQFTSATWINNCQNIVFTGPTGCGKTYMAEAIGLQAIKMGFPAVKKRFRILFEEIHEAKGTGMYLKYLKKLENIKVLIIDDFVMSDIDTEDLNDLMDIIELREQIAPIIITTQYATDKWHLKLPDPTIADAICDRIVHSAFQFNLEGGSMRKSQNK